MGKHRNRRHNHNLRDGKFQEVKEEVVAEPIVEEAPQEEAPQPPQPKFIVSIYVVGSNEPIEFEGLNVQQINQLVDWLNGNSTPTLQMPIEGHLFVVVVRDKVTDILVSLQEETEEAVEA